MFERFTDRARRVLVLSQDEARALDHDFLGTEHILLGLLSEGEGVAAKALANLGVDLPQLRSRVEEVIGRGPAGEVSAAPPFTPRAKHALELSLKEALQLGHNYIGTEHLLLGLLRESEGVACQVLVESGLGLGEVRKEVIQLLSGYTKPSAGERGRRSSQMTMAGERVPRLAEARAVSEPVGSHHFLLALFDDPQSLAARVLASVGLTVEAVADRIAAMGTAGTTDEARPVPGGLRRGLYELGLGRGVTLKVTDPALADELRATLSSAGEAGQPGDLGALIRKAVAEYLSGTGSSHGPEDDKPPDEPAPEPPGP